jgi:hypothetical protein
VSETQRIEVGQTWQERDRRLPALCTVVAIEGSGESGFVYVRRAKQNTRTTRVRIANLRARFRFIPSSAPVPSEGPADAR